MRGIRDGWDGGGDGEEEGSSFPPSEAVWFSCFLFKRVEGLGGRREMKGIKKWEGRRAFVRTQVRIGVARAWAVFFPSV